MQPRYRHLLAACIAIALWPGAPRAATYNHRSVDGKWYDGKAVSSTYGAYDCQLKFTGDRVLIKLAGASSRVVGVLDDEIITDAHEIVVHDPRRGVDWTLDCYNLGN